VTLTRTADGVSIYQNTQGTFYISDGCHSSGISTDPYTQPDWTHAQKYASIGPGYIYRVDVAGKEVIAPRPSSNPPSGLGLFVSDVYQGDPNYSPYSANGYFEAVQGNICRGDPSATGFLLNDGVDDTGSTRVNAGTNTSADSTSYLWAWYDVHLSDRVGRQFEVFYKYRFYVDSVQVWTNVKPCPNGVCYGDPAYATSVGPFMKMPKFVDMLNGPGTDYTGVYCYDANGNLLAAAQQLLDPNGSTVGNHCDGDSRDNIKVAYSSSGLPAFHFRAKAQANFGPGYTLYPWEARTSATRTG
jgi:hypothetical protein